MKKIMVIAAVAAFVSMMSAQTVVDMASFGIKPGTKGNVSAKVGAALSKIKARYGDSGVTLRFAPGRYEFRTKGSLTREYYISNHDQENPKHVAFEISDWDNVTLDCRGAEFIFHGQMLPFAVINSENFSLKNVSVDWDNPHIAQVTVLKNDADGIEFETEPYVRPYIDKEGKFYTEGEGWRLKMRTGIAFDPRTRHIVYRTSDLRINLDNTRKTGERRYLAPSWRDDKLVPGTIVALRNCGRPTPAVFLDGCKNTVLENVKIHYCEGMGLLAQLCDGIRMKGFGVCLRGDDDPRYFTAEADATHFSQCRGHIESVGGLYEGMMDDAINVHGIYLKVEKILGERSVVARHAAPGSYGFRWGEKGDTVEAINAPTMEVTGKRLCIESIKALDKPTAFGAKEFEITFTEPIKGTIEEGKQIGLENLTWCPSVRFADNIVRNNRARGALFSTPLNVTVEGNLFDHTSGAAILVCGDCMGWYETGAFRDMTIRNNRFVNALTNMFQFTEAVISIYPEIHDLASQRKYFHGGNGHAGLLIEDNVFETFDNPILYAKSTQGIVFRRNRIQRNTDFAPFHSNRYMFRLLKTANVSIYSNIYDGCDPSFFEE